MKSAKKEIIVVIGNLMFFIVNIYIFKNVKNYNINTDDILTIYHFSLENIVENITVFIRTFELTDIIIYLFSMLLLYLPITIISLLILLIFNIILFFLNKKTWNSWIKIPSINNYFPRIIILPLLQIIYFTLLSLTLIAFSYLSYINTIAVLQNILNWIFILLYSSILILLSIYIYYKIEYLLTKIIYTGKQDNINKYTIKEYKFFDL